MRGFSPAGAGLILLVGAVLVAGSFAWARPGPRSDPPATMDFWEAAGRGLVTVRVVNETYERDGITLTSPVGIRVDNAADVPVVVSEEALLMSPHPLESPRPDPLRTTQDAVLTVRTIPAGGSLLYSYGEEVLRGFLAPPPWWCSEEFQFTQGGIAFRIGGETLPFALRPVLANEHFEDPEHNTQADFWAYLRAHATVAVGKEPLWTRIDEPAGQRVHVTIVATNLAVYGYDDAITADVNVTQGALEDDVPAGWSVEEGSYSIAPDAVVDHADGSRTLRWFVNLPAALESDQEDPRYPTAYESVTRSYTLVSPAQDAGRVVLPRARSDMDADGVADSASAAPVLEVGPVGVPVANAGGPYAGREGDTIRLDASGSTDPGGDAIRYRWDFTGDGTFDTQWSSDPTAEARYTDDFRGSTVVEVGDGRHVASARAEVTIANVAPEIRRLDALAQAAFRIEMAGEKWHDLAFTIESDERVLASLELERTPGNPAAQAATTDLLTLSLRDHASATLTYTPEDDPVNGRPSGDSPAWIVVMIPDGRETRIAHNFNTQHRATWTWSSDDLVGFLLRAGITLRAELHDAGSDDLFVTWNFGDGTPVSEVFYNDGVGSDPPQSQGGTAPFDVAAEVVHGYANPGPFVVTLTVRDDDGGMTTESLTLGLP